MCSKQRVCFVLGSPGLEDCHVADEEIAALKKSAGVSRGKDKCQLRSKGRERDYWIVLTR